MTRPRLVVNEIFGPTVQGEGPSAGRRCSFLRLGGCNLSCRWCDTPYTWDWKGIGDSGTAYDPRVELTTRDVDDVIGEILRLRTRLLVVSGGEPLSQQAGLLPVLTALRDEGVQVEIETNGTVAPLDRVVDAGVRFNVSPKLAHSRDPYERRIVPAAIKKLNDTQDVAFKFVCRTTGDLDEVSALQSSFDLTSVWIMPEGTRAADVNTHLRNLAAETIRRGWNLSTRLHVLIWDDKRGV
ncbi:7-carboxy-7-deazaguanine synthase QueE [Kitasatospora sp. NPDC088346]|uniref:7-carboxy-7-deazaguanine synthase QueE n=1 Tax=Kitasatospora sp. NPDC088346 TaxID=3364073 RepID=UPI0037FDEB7B